jgi:hypothetical protein
MVLQAALHWCDELTKACWLLGLSDHYGRSQSTIAESSDLIYVFWITPITVVKSYGRNQRDFPLSEAQMKVASGGQ